MRKAQYIETDDYTGERLRAYDLREIDNPDPRDAFRLKYLARLHAIVAAVQHYAKPGERVLEVGCSQGNIAISLGERGYFSVATDLLPEALRYAATKDTTRMCHLAAADVRALPFSEDAFDILVIGELIEHLPQPCATLSSVARTLKPGGIAVITVPNGRFFRSKVEPYSGDMPSQRAQSVTTGPEACDHIYEFDRQTLAELVKSAGLTLLRIEYTGSVLLSPRAAAIKRLLPIRATMTLSRWLNRMPYIADRLSYNIILIAQRPVQAYLRNAPQKAYNAH